MLDIFYLIPLFPVIAFLIIAFYGNYLKEGGAYIALFFALISLVISIYMFIAVLTQPSYSSDVYITWFSLPSGPTFEIGMLIDNFSAIMIFVVQTVSFLVIMFSIGYMHDDPSLRRYYAEISLFLGVMSGLVLSDNYLEMFIFWELVGLCSYLLIGFWYEKPSAAAAAKKAFLVTKVGDVMLLFGMIILLDMSHTPLALNFTQLYAWAASSSFNTTALNTLTIVTFLIFGGAVGKSAQFPLHVWLPDAMEGPTTVSALIHAATMVKAGVFLMVRTMPLLGYTQFTEFVIAAVGGFTAFFAATMALVSPDIKRVLAYSTISQLGYMFVAIGAGSAGAAMFHLMSHAFFKALLFLAAGSVIHAAKTQDLFKMGGLYSKMKITSLTMLIGALSLSGIPPFSGFFSKDLILDTVYSKSPGSLLYTIVFILAFITVYLTAFYMFRLWYMTFYGKGRSEMHVHESPSVMTIPLIVLAAFATFSWAFMLYHPFTQMITVSLSFNVYLMSGGILLGLAGIGTAYVMYSKGIPTLPSSSIVKGIHKMLYKKYWFDEVYGAFSMYVVYGFAKLIDLFDRYIIDGVVNGIATGASMMSKYWANAGDSLIKNYVLYIISGLIGILILLVYIFPFVWGGAY
ncbi:MAG: NADH-quinone oxidoreductase subunit L [Thermoplasmata archaeon]